jgi:hypothetical protein
MDTVAVQKFETISLNAKTFLPGKKILKRLDPNLLNLVFCIPPFCLNDCLYPVRHRS